jgi:hypothetical protein
VVAVACRPVVVNIGRAGMATDNVTQRVIMIKENEKAHRYDPQTMMCGSLCVQHRSSAGGSHRVLAGV